MEKIFLAWVGGPKSRNEFLASLLEAETVYMPNRFSSKILRSADYLLKLWKTWRLIRRRRPGLVFLQFPTIFIALPFYLARVPYVIDAHNSTWQSFWHAVPFARPMLRKAVAVIPHNEGILKLAEQADPEARFAMVLNPVPAIRRDVERIDRKVMLVCSFAEDEPVGEIMEAVRRLQGKYSLLIPGSLQKIPLELRRELQAMEQVELTGFLSQEEYEKHLCSSACIVVLTTRENCQPNGACEALAAGTPLIVSRSRLTEKLFGEWAHLVENDWEDIVEKIENLPEEATGIEAYRKKWQAEVRGQIERLFETMRDSGVQI